MASGNPALLLICMCVPDSARYGIYSFVTALEKPLEMRMREAMQPFVQTGDMTSALIRTQQMKEEQSYSSKPATLGRRRR
jgi:hypothetical protein